MFVCDLKTKNQEKIFDLLVKCMNRAESLCLKLPNTEVEIDFSLNSVNYAGTAQHDDRGNDLKIELHGKALEHYGWAKFMDTAIHEFVHILQFVNYPDCPPHGYEFKYLMRQMGIKDPERCHEYNLYEVTGKKRRRQRRWAYGCECKGKTHSIATVTHNRIKKGQGRICKLCKGDLWFTGKELK